MRGGKTGRLGIQTDEAADTVGGGAAGALFQEPACQDKSDDHHDGVKERMGRHSVGGPRSAGPRK